MNPTVNSLDETRRGWRRRQWLRFLMLGTPVWLAAQAMAVEPRWLRTRQVRVHGRGQVRFAYFTDLHFKGDPRLMERVVRWVNRVRPAFAVFGGDLVEHTDHLAEALAGLGRIEVPLYGVPGNHDYWSGADFDRIGATFGATGGRWLLDESVEAAGTGLWLAGHTCAGDQILPAEKERRTIGLIHYPAWADRLSPGFELVLAGHSHGGQVRLPFLGAMVKPSGVGRYERGRYSTRAGPLYVSSGVGTFFINVRFLCPPEVVLVEV